MNRFVIPFVLSALAAAAPLSIHAAESVYTGTSIDKCENLLTNPDQDDIDMRRVSVKCAGYKDYPFYFNETDDTQSANFGHLDSRIVEEARETFEGPNHVGSTIEWRLDDKGVPRAAILNYIMETFDDETLLRPALDDDARRNGEILVVSRVGQPEDRTGCVTAYVDALENTDALALARKLADEQAPSFPCGKEQPRFHGKTGEWSGQPMNDYPDLSEAN